MKESGWEMILQDFLPLSQQLERPHVPGGAGTRWWLLPQTMSQADYEVEPPHMCIPVLCSVHDLEIKFSLNHFDLQLMCYYSTA